MSSSIPLIDLRDVKKQYINDGVATTVLHGVSFAIQEGEFVALMGPSGSGKSTLMHILGFLDRLTEGAYFFRGQDVSRLDDNALTAMRRDQVGFVFQAFHLLPKSSVIDNIMLPMMYVGVPRSERRKKAEQALDSVGLSHRTDHLSNQLSGGERQRVAIARALVNNPSLLFADEPTGNLDSKSGSDVLQLLQNLHTSGHTIIMVTHESEAAEHAERIIRIRDGLLVSDARDHARRQGSIYNK
ncbi:MAG: ABC transporter related protein [Candidatus Uhrbacteria bacterium GW2011_GWF2_41_16]|uniref:ABC transporter related protein n=2 Tax=Candidatus Uhriibacteriota TaxID=1752732 RepID=A0A0G0VCU9_9BACT|nr:MAG: ABC transporter related protein [Candidatus Uhrbacteria bacterium GW2011_GWA2_41_10]KKR87769.1 MAG: ABC transporter related protein [Candidatus Uhrbacteria bacterium GW2011_GWC2_41_11]KKR98708.1 MAG: ABC transporter related protein [Candidatus Uhrbacteria bacterium GW2011_GWF2_41_16]HBP00195.1 macrolide ABC transporter ATP-binding protein [Candidatus Uhrbacteria bacterium]